MDNHPDCHHLSPDRLLLDRGDSPTTEGFIVRFIPENFEEMFHSPGAPGEHRDLSEIDAHFEKSGWVAIKYPTPMDGAIVEEQVIRGRVKEGNLVFYKAPYDTEEDFAGMILVEGHTPGESGSVFYGFFPKRGEPAKTDMGNGLFVTPGRAGMSLSMMLDEKEDWKPGVSMVDHTEEE